MRPMYRLAAVLIAALLPLAACSPEDSTAPAAASWRLASMPEGPVGVRHAKENAAEGDTVAVRGIIGGRKDAIGAESAVFIMMDPNLENVCVSEDDHCATPWDYCCARPEDIQANSATVQLVGEDGQPLAINLTAQGISPLDEVVVVGTVAARPSPQVLTIRATGLHRVTR